MLRWASAQAAFAMSRNCRSPGETSQPRIRQCEDARRPPLRAVRKGSRYDAPQLCGATVFTVGDAQEREQALDWLVGSVEPFGAPPERQVEIFGADRSDVIEMVNQVEDMLSWELRVLADAGLADELIAAEVSAICEEAFRLGRLDECQTSLW